MERFEVLGDGYLKFISSMFLYSEYQDWHEGNLTTLKSKIIGNRNLFYIGDKLGLPGIIKATMFRAKETIPPSAALSLEGQRILREYEMQMNELMTTNDKTKKAEIENNMNALKLRLFKREQSQIQDQSNCMLNYMKKHQVSDKNVADAVEALIGVVVQSKGVFAALKLCHKLIIFPAHKNVDKLLKEVKFSAGFNAVADGDVTITNQGGLENKIGYQFKNRKLLSQALTHASCINKPVGSYQRLEFLGDAVLDFLITAFTFEQCPELGPGKLTDLRSALVKNVTLASTIIRHDLHKFLQAENSELSSAIARFAHHQSINGHHVVLDQMVVTKTADGHEVAEALNIPKAIGDMFESIVGAVFLDSGLNFTVTWNLIYRLLQKEIEEFMRDIPIDIVRQLYEYNKGSAKPKFQPATKKGESSFCITVNIICRGVKKSFQGYGKNGELAKKCAAKVAMKALESF